MSLIRFKLLLLYMNIHIMLRKVSRKILSITATTTATMLIFSAQTQAAVVAFNESLGSPDASSNYWIGVPDLFGDGSPVGLRLKTLSYGGGKTWESPITSGGNPVSRTVSSGGFDPIITLSNSIGNLIKRVDDSSILGNQADPSTGRIYDSAFDIKVNPGNYQIKVTQYDNFDGNGLNRITGFTDVTGSGRTNKFTVQTHTISDYLSNSVSVNVNGGMIRANFEPKTTNLFNNLFDLAAFGSFNHFNWLNIVEDKNILAMQPTGPGLGDFDPLPGGNTPLQTNDNFRWYFDEAPNNSPYIWSKYYRNNNTQAIWGDSPNLVVPGASITFKTYLAGIRGGDYGTVFANVDGNSFKNLAFKWTYTQGFSGGTINLFADPDSQQDNGGTIDFLGFLQPEDWTQESIEQLEKLGVNIAGLKGGTITTLTTIPEKSSSLTILIVAVASFLLYKRNNKGKVK
jgi:hypothetical protein